VLAALAENEPVIRQLIPFNDGRRAVVVRGDGVFLCGDMVAAPGLLAEVAFTSARRAARATVAELARARAVAAR
jgi:hypothetical protein